MHKKIRVAIAGGTGYTGGELFRILLNHPDVEIVAATTTSSEGTPVASVHRDLIGETDMCFGKELNDPDVIFLCLGHGISRQFVDTHEIKPECRIIDLGNDFRLDGDYAGRHFVYGLCESAREEVRNAHDVANPGCFATAIQLAALPLASAGLIHDEIHVTAITGSTGAGKKPGETTHFSYRSDNISIYKLFAHQHLAEIKQNLSRCHPERSEGAFSPIVNFVPLRGDYTRGIFASVYTKAAEGMSEDDYGNTHLVRGKIIFLNDFSKSLSKSINKALFSKFCRKLFYGIFDQGYTVIVFAGKEFCHFKTISTDINSKN